MDVELFTQEIFSKNMETFVPLGKKRAFFAVCLESFKQLNVDSGSFDLATESDIDHVLTLYV